MIVAKGANARIQRDGGFRTPGFGLVGDGGSPPPEYIAPSGAPAALVLDFNSGPYYAADTGSGLVTATQSLITNFSAIVTGADGIQRLRTVNGDVPTVAVAGFDFSATAGTILCVGRFNDVATNERMWQIDDGTTSNRIAIYMASGGQWRAFMQAGGVTTADLTMAVYTSDTVVRVAVSWGAAGMRTSMNGATLVTDSSITVPAVSTLRLGHTNSGDAVGGGIRSLTYWNTQLSDSDVQTLATAA